MGVNVCSDFFEPTFAIGFEDVVAAIDEKIGGVLQVGIGDAFGVDIFGVENEVVVSHVELGFGIKFFIARHSGVFYLHKTFELSFDFFVFFDGVGFAQLVSVFVNIGNAGDTTSNVGVISNVANSFIVNVADDTGASVGVKRRGN